MPTLANLGAGGTPALTQNPWGTMGDPAQAIQQYMLQQGFVRGPSDDEGNPGGWGRMVETDGDGYNPGQRFVPLSAAQGDGYRDPNEAITEYQQSQNQVTIGGQQYLRLGPGGTDVAPQIAALGVNPQYHPQYGYIVPAQDFADSLVANSLNSGWGAFDQMLSDYGPALVAGGFIGMAGLAGGLGAAAGAEGLAGGLAGDALGLAQMGQAAGLSGEALNAFVASGGTLGSTAAGGGGIGLGALNNGLSIGNAPGIGEGYFQNVNAPVDGSVALGQDPLTLGEIPGYGGGVSGSGSGIAGAANPVPFNALDPSTWSNAFDLPNIPTPPTGGGGGGGEGYPDLLGTGGANAPAGTPGLGQGSQYGAAGGNGALSWLSQATGIPEGVLSGLGTLGQGALGLLAGNQQADAYSDIANQLRADRAPALNAFNNALNNPNTWYNSAPAMGAANATLSRLSMQGNPAGNPGAMAQSAAYNLGGYNDYLRSLSGPAFGTVNAETNVNVGSAQQQGGMWEAGGSLLQNLLQPARTPQYNFNLGSWLT